MSADVRIVLVRPSGETNIGSVARALANMGLRELVLVAPQCNHLSDSACAYAVRAVNVLENARVVDSIPAALDGCNRTYATTAKLGMYRRRAAVSARAAAAEIATTSAESAIAIAFGPEDRGLLVEETLQFDRLIHIPSDDAYPALNLAAAVMIVAYELRLARLAAADQPELPHAIRGPLAEETPKAVMFELMFAALKEIGFLYGPHPEHLQYALRHMLGRIDLTRNEVDILTGIGRQISWYVRHHPPTTGRAFPAPPTGEQQP